MREKEGGQATEGFENEDQELVLGTGVRWQPVPV